MSEQPEVKFANIVVETSEALLKRVVCEALVATIETLDIAGVQKKIEIHDKLLYGDVRPGLIEEITMLKPLVSKVEDHLKSFKKFELETVTERQAVQDNLKSIQDSVNGLKRTVEKEMLDFKEKIKPFENMMENFQKFYTSMAVLGAVGGAALVGFAWIASNWVIVKGWFHHAN